MMNLSHLVHLLICLISVVENKPLMTRDNMLNEEGQSTQKSKNMKIKDFSNLIEMANKKEDRADLAEYDMKLLKIKHRRRRLATTVEYWKWSNIIPFVFDTVLPVDEELKNLTLQAFQHVEEYTCIKFISRTNETDYINVTALSGCWSYIGKKGGMQELSLASGGCNDFNVVLHEALHALGFYHEHSRPDRDKYIVVNFTNVKPGFESNLQKRNLTDSINGDATLQNISYDKQSVMHYGRYTFTKHIDEFGYIYSGQENMTMYVIGNPEEQLGSEDGLSYKDKIRVNRLYNCNVTVATETTSAMLNVTTTTKMSINNPSTTSTTTSNQSTSSTTSNSGETTTPTTPSTNATSAKTTHSTTESSTTKPLIETTSETTSSRQSTIATLDKTEQTPSVFVTTTTNGSNWGKPDSGMIQTSSFPVILTVLLITITFMSFG